MTLTENALRKIAGIPSARMLHLARACDNVQACAENKTATAAVRAHAKTQAARHRSMLIDVLATTRGAELGTQLAQALGQP